MQQTTLLIMHAMTADTLLTLLSQMRYLYSLIQLGMYKAGPHTGS